MILKGTCHSELEERVSSKGNPYGVFYVEAASKIWKVMIFGEKVEYAKRNVRSGEKVVVDGKKPEGEDDNLISAFNLTFPALQKTRTWDIKQYTKGYREYVEHQKTLGFVEWRDEHGKSRLEKRKYCVCVDGTWRSSIEFAMDIFGGDTVKEMLRELGVLDWAVRDWRKKREAINQITEAAIEKHRDNNPGGVSVIRGWQEEEQVPSSENTSGRDLVPLETGSSQVHGTEDTGACGDDKGAGTTEVI